MDVEETCLLAGTPGQVYDLMCDEGFQRRKAERLDTLEFTMSDSTTDDGRREIRTERVMATQGMPEFVKALVRPTMRVREVETWIRGGDGDLAGDFTIDVDGAPMYLRGSVQIQAVPDTGSRLTFAGTVTATVPLFKARVAEASAASVVETIRTEFALLAEELGVPEGAPAP